MLELVLLFAGMIDLCKTVLDRIGLSAAKPVDPAAHDTTPVEEMSIAELEALIANRYEVMARFGRELKVAAARELEKVKAQGGKHSAQWRQFKLAHRWLHRDSDRIPSEHVPELAAARLASPALDKLILMREELRQMWTRTNVSAEQLVKELQAWCQRAEESGIAELRALSIRLRAARMGQGAFA